MSIAYFFNQYTFKMNGFAEIINYSINIDEETNGVTEISIIKKIDIKDGDLVFIKDKTSTVFSGVVSEINNVNGEKKYTISAKWITNIFDKDIILSNSNLISSTGLEDFIKNAIETYFSNSADNLLNLSYLSVSASTHNRYTFSVETNNGIYNLHTFMQNCSQKYNIVYDFSIDDTLGDYKLNLNISTAVYSNTIVDSNVSDIFNYEEVRQTDILSKVTVLSSGNSIYNLFLKTDRTTTTNASDENRAVGKSTTIYVEDSANARQEALNQFKGNQYEHFVSFDVKNDSKIYDVDSWKIGMPLKIKTRSGDILNTYISAISKEMGCFKYHFTTGSIRVTLIDKLKKERGK